MRETPVSFLVSAHNNQKYILASVRSLLSQTWIEYEIVIVDDASTDGTAAILEEFTHYDSRIRVIRNHENLGLTKSLNIGLARCGGTYIARMDADDIALPDRLQKQLDFLESNPNVAACGSLGVYIDEAGKEIGPKDLPTTYEAIKKKLLFNNQFIHSSLFFRKSVLDKMGGYNEAFKTAQDYELMMRIAATYPVANLSDRLIKWRVRRGSISWKSKQQEIDGIRVRWRAITRFGYPKMKGLYLIILRLGWMILPQRWKMRRYTSTRAPHTAGHISTNTN